MTNKRVYLTPSLFRKLDTIARTEVGSIVAVYPRGSAAGEPLGYVAAMADSVYNCPRHEAERSGVLWSASDDVTHVATDMTVIYMANYIELGRIPGSGREFDWSNIPTSKLYEFLLWHEIAHIVCGDTSFNFNFQSSVLWSDPVHRRSFAMLRRGQEIRADRYAWSKLFQTSAMPKKLLGDTKADVLLSFVDDHELKYRNFPVKIPPPISIKPDEYIYWKHKKEGIPWAGPAKALARNQAAAEQLPV